MGSGQNPGEGSGGNHLEKFFNLYFQNRRKLAHRKNEILVLFCAMIPADIFTIHQINNSSFFNVKYVLPERRLVMELTPFREKKWNIKKELIKTEITI